VEQQPGGPARPERHDDCPHTRRAKRKCLGHHAAEQWRGYGLQHRRELLGLILWAEPRLHIQVQCS
jgi:hypothetical protein